MGPASDDSSESPEFLAVLRAENEAYLGCRRVLGKYCRLLVVYGSGVRNDFLWRSVPFGRYDPAFALSVRFVLDVERVLSKVDLEDRCFLLFRLGCGVPVYEIAKCFRCSSGRVARARTSESPFSLNDRPRASHEKLTLRDRLR